MTTSVISNAQLPIGGTLRVSQAAHGFTQGQAIQMDGATWTLAQADDVNTLGVGLADVIDANTFRVVHSGAITGLAGLTAGDYYFVSSTTAGALTSTEPVTGFSNPILLATSATAGVVLPYRPSGTGVATAQYVLAILSGSDQTTNIAVGDHVKFSNVLSQTGSHIGLDTTTPYTNANAVASIGRITLQPGYTYKLVSGLMAGGTPAGGIRTRWADVTTAATGLGPASWASFEQSGINESNQSVTYVTPTSTMLVELRFDYVANITTLYAASATLAENTGCWCSVEAVAATVQPSTTRHEVRLHTQGGWGSTNTKIKYFTTVGSSIGTALTVTQSSVNGDSILVNESGLYQVHGFFWPTGPGTEGITVNAPNGASGIELQPMANVLTIVSATASGYYEQASWSGWLQAGDVLRWHGQGTTTTSSASNKFEVVKIG